MFLSRYSRSGLGALVLLGSAALTSCGRTLSMAVPGAPGLAAATPEPGAPRVAVRSYPGAPLTEVIGWSTNEGYQGLRASIRLDGTLVRDHQVFVSDYAVPNLQSLQSGSWFAFGNGMTSKEQLQAWGLRKDSFNCVGTPDCTPPAFYGARITDEFLRASRDSIAFRILDVRGMSETFLTLHEPLVTRYLAVVDSVRSVRRKSVASRD